MNAATCAVFFHNYYGSHEEWIRSFCEKITIPFTVYYNIVEGSLFSGADRRDVLDKMKRSVSGPYLQKIVLRQSPNQGKDIGGKLVLMDAWLRNGKAHDYIIFLHDKRSPHKVQSREWAGKLFQIIEPAFIKRAIGYLTKHREAGIIAPSDTILNEYDPEKGLFVSNNREQLIMLRSALHLSNTDYRYVAGTMFWARAAPLAEFFEKHAPLDIRQTLEKGNVMDDYAGTSTHAWERLLSWLIFAQGYTLKGL